MNLLNSLAFRDFIIYGTLVILVLYVTKQYNLWGVRKGTSKTKVDVRKAQEAANYRNIILWILNKAEGVARNFGFQPSIAIIEKYQYNIFRGRLAVPYIDRNINFEYADPELVDYYVYKIKAGQSKLDTLIKEAKKNGLVLDMINAIDIKENLENTEAV